MEVKPKSPTATYNRRVVVLFFAVSLLAALAGFGVPSAALAASPAAPLYAVTDLGTGSGIVSHAVAINEAGDVIGETNHEYAPTLAFLYSGGVLRELLDIPAEQSSAIAFNERGEIVVSTYTGYALYSAGVTNALPGGFLPHDIDNGGRIVGSLNARDDEHTVWDHPHGALYSDGGVVDLGFVGGATAINEGGDIAGFSMVEDQTLGTGPHAFVRPAGGTNVDLGSLSGHAGESRASDVSDQGVVVGFSSTPAGGYHAFRYRPGGTMEDLGIFGGYGHHSAAHAVNTAGDIVGEATCDSADRPLRAAMWRDGELWDLNDLIRPGTGWALEGAVDINDSGSVVGWGWFAGHRRAVLLTPAPVQPQYHFGGFAPPINARPTLNVVRAGATVPVRFSLSGYQGADVFAPGYPLSQSVCVGTDAPVDPVEQTSTAGSSGLTYSPGSGLYTYAWKTDPAWAGTHRQIVLGLADGTYYRATFDLR